MISPVPSASSCSLATTALPRTGIRATRGVDQPRIQAAVREILLAIGEDPDRDGLTDTPARVARAYAEMFAGLFQSPASHLARVFDDPHADVVVLRGIPFSSMCEHHLLPFTGRAHVAYWPAGGKIVGLSKLARTVDVYAKRPQVQERMTNQIADAIDFHLKPHGVAVVLKAQHACMKVRGVNKCGSSMRTLAVRGQYAEDPVARSQVMLMLLTPPGGQSE